MDHTKKIESFIKKKLAALGDHEHTRTKLRVLLKECGWTRRSDGAMAQIQGACEAAGIWPEPMLTATGLGPEDQIYFSKTKPRPYTKEIYSSLSFSSEKALQKFLLENFESIPEFKRLRKPKAEYRLPSGRRIDILCREKSSGDYVVIELKKRKQDAVGQILGYMEEVNRTLAGREQKNVRGIIVKGQPNRAIQRAIGDKLQGYPIEWIHYVVNLNFF